MNNKNEILNKVDEIINDIKSTKEYKEYLYLKDKINNNQELKMLINEVKVLNQDVIHGYNKKELLEEKETILNNDPLYREYLNIVYEINNKYQIIETTLNNYIDRKINN